MTRIHAKRIKGSLSLLLSLLSSPPSVCARANGPARPPSPLLGPLSPHLSVKDPCRHGGEGTKENCVATDGLTDTEKTLLFFSSPPAKLSALVPSFGPIDPRFAPCYPLLSFFLSSAVGEKVT